jgi:glycosyltransferase involved in cell wall biosynthesis
MRTLVLMPTYNEASGIQHSIQELLDQVPDVDVVVIDDNSPDNTAQLVASSFASNNRVHVLSRSAKQGLGKAYLAGYDWGIERGYERLVQMDADGSHRPEDLKALLRAEADLVIGSRWISGGSVKNWPRHREALSRFGNWYAGITTGLKVRDLTAGFRVYSARFLSDLNLERLEAQGYGFQVEMTRRAIARGATWVEIPITFVERESGVSKMTTEIILEAFWLCTKWGLERLVRR